MPNDWLELECQGETGRASIRRLTPDGVTERHVAWLRDPELRGMFPVSGAVTAAAIKALARAHEKRPAGESNLILSLLDIESAAPRRPVGMVLLVANRAHARVDLVAVLGERSTFDGGAGGFEALGALIDSLFGRSDMAKVAANLLANDDRTAAVLEALGFRKEGVWREHFRTDGGDWRDVALYGLPREDRPARQVKS